MTRSLGRQRCKYVKYSENIYSRQAKCHFHKIKKINMVGFHNKGHIPRVQFAPLVKKKCTDFHHLSQDKYYFKRHTRFNIIPKAFDN